jgi:hypothetical protein
VCVWEEGREGEGEGAEGSGKEVTWQWSERMVCKEKKTRSFRGTTTRAGDAGVCACVCVSTTATALGVAAAAAPPPPPFSLI